MTVRRETWPSTPPELKVRDSTARFDNFMTEERLRWRSDPRDHAESARNDEWQVIGLTAI
jgi:hypothetical protein